MANMVSNLIDELLDAASTDYALLGQSESLRINTLTSAQLAEGAGVYIGADKNLLSQLNFDDSNIPAALRMGMPGGYDPNAAFQAAHSAMAASLSASIDDVLTTIRTEGSRIQRYFEAKPFVAWRSRRDDTVSAFENVITSVENQNIETNSAFVTIKASMRTIYDEIKPLMGLPSNITPQIALLHQALAKFDKVSSGEEFEKLFVLERRKIDFSLATDRTTGMTLGGRSILLGMLNPLITAPNHTKKVRQTYWRHWLTMLDSLKLAAEAFHYYHELGLDIAADMGTPLIPGTPRIPGTPASPWWAWGGTRTPAVPAIPAGPDTPAVPPKPQSPLVLLLSQARDALVNELITILLTGAAPLRAIGTEISTLPRPALATTGVLITANIKYISDVINVLLKIEPEVKL